MGSIPAQGMDIAHVIVLGTETLRKADLPSNLQKNSHFQK